MGHFSSAISQERYGSVRAYTESLAQQLTSEDQCVQSMPDASPVKWHRAHITWFFEEFVLGPNLPGYMPFDPDFRFLFNSYYDSVGARHPRPARGLLTRPSSERIGEYRAYVDAAMRRLLAVGVPPEGAALIELGLQHEQQHQELMLTDMLHAFAQSPIAPSVLPGWHEDAGRDDRTRPLAHPGGLVELGMSGEGFAFDNEMPQHQVWLRPFLISNRLVRNGEWLEFMADQGYRKPALWMSDGWAAAQEQRWQAPLYWREYDGVWFQMGPGGLAQLDPAAPVRHVSWYEADAFARWADARLPTEFEWEAAAVALGLPEAHSHVWQWTASAYLPYPGFRPAPGAVGEYNGKFMINQMVLRGGSIATPPGHARLSYRNFFHPEKRWQFSGLRLAWDA